MKKVQLVLVGAFAGQTVRLNAGTRTLEFDEGVLDLQGPEKDVDLLCRYLARSYQAYPEGSKELREAQEALDAAEADADDAQAGDGDPGGSDDPAGGDGQGTTQQTDPAGGGTDGAAATGQAGSEDAGGDRQGPIAEVLKKLDPADDEHWTADGRPKMAAVEALLGRSDVTRSEVDEALPGFNREAAAG